MKRDIVHQHLYAVWGAQACRRPSDWSDAIATSAALRTTMNEAVAGLVAAFDADEPPDDPVMAVWIALPKLDLVHRTRLAELLMRERVTDGQV